LEGSVRFSFVVTVGVLPILPEAFHPDTGIAFGVVVTERLQALFLRCGFLSPVTF
jgi:hypothetical protein